MLARSAKRVDPRLTSGEIIFEEFRSEYLNVTDGRTDGHDGRLTMTIPRSA